MRRTRRYPTITQDASTRRFSSQVIDLAGAVSPDLMLREKELMSYKKFPPFRASETYNLDGILKKNPGGECEPPQRIAGTRRANIAKQAPFVCEGTSAVGESHRTAFASVGQPTEPCLAPQQNAPSSGARHWRPLRHVGLGGCPSLGGCETVATAGDSVIGPQVVQWPRREYLRPVLQQFARPRRCVELKRSQFVSPVQANSRFHHR